MEITLDLERSQYSEPFFKEIFNLGYPISTSKNAKILVKQAEFITNEDLESGKKILAVEKTDGANISHKHVLVHPSVIRYVKQYNYASYVHHNLPCVDGRLFTRSLDREENFKASPIEITQEHYNKISLGWNILHHGRMDIMIPENENTEIIDGRRDIDVFFVGTIDYCNSNSLRKSGDLIREHREKCIDIIHSLKGVRVLAMDGRRYTHQEHVEMLKKVKIVVSPWGWGEACYRDYEAVLAGCILIKPLTDFVTSSCKIFEGSFCRWVNPNFSDLPEAIEAAMSDYKDSYSERFNNRNKLIASYKNLPAIVKSAVDILQV